MPAHAQSRYAHADAAMLTVTAAVGVGDFPGYRYGRLRPGPTCDANNRLICTDCSYSMLVAAWMQNRAFCAASGTGDFGPFVWTTTAGGGGPTGFPGGPYGPTGRFTLA